MIITRLQAKKYFEYTRKHTGHHKRIAEEIAKVANIDKNDSILEVGLGTGASTEVFLKYLGQEGILDGVEVSRNMLFFFKKNIQDPRVRKVISGDAKNILKYFKERKYDRIICSNSFFWIRDIKSFLKGVSILLKRSGRFLFSIQGSYIIDYDFDNVEELLDRASLRYLKNETRMVIIDRPDDAIDDFSKIFNKRFLSTYNIKRESFFKLGPKINRSQILKESKKRWVKAGLLLDDIKSRNRAPLVIYSSTLK